MNRITFPVRTGFHQRLNRRVNQYFKQNGLAKSGDWRMFLKTALILVSTVSSYTYLIFFASSFLGAAVSALLLALGIVMIGFNIMHDGAHGSYSNNRKINRMMAWTLDLIGGSQMLWHQKHNILHHTYTNICEMDDDLDTSGLLRLSPEQQRRSWHRFQHWYAFPLYSLLTINGVLYADFRKFFTGRIGAYELKRPSAGQTVSFFSAKALYLGYAIGLPMLFHPGLVVVSFFIFVHLVSGSIFSLVFQLAHTVEDNLFPSPDPKTGFMEEEWAIHEVQTTANFATGNAVLTWFCGGLNFQIEHHLFSRVCHIHYPTISRLLRDTCEEFQVRYNCYPTIRAAIVEHYRFLKRLGRSDADNSRSLVTDASDSTGTQNELT